MNSVVSVLHDVHRPSGVPAIDEAGGIGRATKGPDELTALARRGPPLKGAFAVLIGTGLFLDPTLPLQ